MQIQIPVKYTHLCTIACLIGILWGCSKEIETKDIYSSDRAFIIRIETDESGGAAVSDVTSVYLLPSTSMNNKKLIFKGSSMANFRVNWQGPGQIGLSYSDGFVSQCNGGPILFGDRSVKVSGCK
jgi:hypothetical protein